MAGLLDLGFPIPQSDLSTALSSCCLTTKWSLLTVLFFGSGTAESPISHLVRTAAARLQQILNHVIG